MKLDPTFVLLYRIFLCTSLTGSLLWIADYSRSGWWRNPVGKNLVTKTAIITLLLAISLVGSLVRLDPLALEILRWCDLVLLAAIGPVMVWRMVVFHWIAGEVIACPAGHEISSASNFCPHCGLRVVPGPSSR